MQSWPPFPPPVLKEAGKEATMEGGQTDSQENKNRHPLLSNSLSVS